jgi:UDP-glucuronate decarboxylase
LDALYGERGGAVRVLVTGAAGFIGGHLCRRLIIDGHEVTGIDDLSTGSRSNLHPDVEFVRWDVRDPFRGDFDWIFHLAAPASPAAYMLNPTRTLETILLGARNALACARECGGGVILASTSEVYGDPLEHPQKETYWGNVNPLSPRGCYEESKRAAETLAWGWSGQHGTVVRLVRIFNTYGPRMNPKDGRLIPNLVTQALAGEQLTVYGDGKQTRSLCYVTDTVAALVGLANPGLAGKRLVMNVGNPDEKTIIQIATAVRAAVGNAASQIKSEPLPQDDPRRRCPDVSRARTWLGWEPKVAFDEGLRRTIAWFRDGAEWS